MLRYSGDIKQYFGPTLRLQGLTGFCSHHGLDFLLFVCVVFVPSLHVHLLLWLQVTEAHSESGRDQEWLDHINHILQQKVRLICLQ